MLLNPWVKTAQGEASTYLRHYYLKRLFDPSFWKKLISRRGFGSTFSGEFGTARTVVGASTPNSQALPDRMAAALCRAGKPVRVILSGRDYVAREFELIALKKNDGAWKSLLAASPPLRIE